jgi:hypothetical protein
MPSSWQVSSRCRSELASGVSARSGHLGRHAVGQADGTVAPVVVPRPQPARPTGGVTVDDERLGQAELGEIEHRLLLVHSHEVVVLYVPIPDRHPRADLRCGG